MSRKNFSSILHYDTTIGWKSCEDHESPHFYVSTTLSFRVILFLNSIFLDLYFFLKIFGFQFSNFLAIFFKCLFLAKEFSEQKKIERKLANFEVMN